MRQDMRRNTWSIVAHLDLRQIIHAAQRDFDRSTPAAERDGIDQQVEKNLLDAAGIAGNDERGIVALKRDRLLAGNDLDRVYHAASEIGEIGRGAIDLEARGGEPDDVDDLVRELGQPPRLLRSAGNVLPQALVT